MLDLLRLELALDDKSSRPIHRTRRTHLSKHVLNDVLGLSVHPLANFRDVGEDGLLVSFTQHLGRSDCVALACRSEKRGVGGV